MQKYKFYRDLILNIELTLFLSSAIEKKSCPYSKYLMLPAQMSDLCHQAPAKAFKMVGIRLCEVLFSALNQDLPSIVYYKS